MTALPDWMRGMAPPDDGDDDEPAGIRRCSCGGEGCDSCENTGVIYP